jgi:hypothetical protein
MKSFAFISLLTLAAALPTQLTAEKAEHQLYARDPQRFGRGFGGFGRGLGGGFGGLLGGLTGGLGGIVSGIGGSLLSLPLDLAGGLVGSFLPIRVATDGTYEVVQKWEDANGMIPNPAVAEAAAAAPAPAAQ